MTKNKNNPKLSSKAPSTEADPMAHLKKEDAPLAAVDERTDEASEEIVDALDEAKRAARLERKDSPAK
ncbi:MAG: hypothetical protein J0L93_07150 [Deltaproteobacteria bacterium]|nr:hypothetical protein [Deltaproteobacteria bacterium]